MAIIMTLWIGNGAVLNRSGESQLNEVLETLWEKEKLLVTSNFSFSHSVFYPFRELSDIFNNHEIVVCKPFQFGRV